MKERLQERQRKSGDKRLWCGNRCRRKHAGSVAGELHLGDLLVGPKGVGVLKFGWGGITYLSDKQGVP